MIKNALFLVCALVAIQGLQARSIDLGAKDTIDRIKQDISDIISTISKLIHNTRDSVGEIIIKIKKEIEVIIQTSDYENERKCIASQQENINALIEFAQSGMKACVAEAESKTDALKEQLDVLVDKANALRDDVIARALECAQDNPLNPIALAICLKERVEPINKEIAALQKEVVDTIAVAKVTVALVGQTLDECSEVAAEIPAKQEEILNNIRNCIQRSTA